MEIEIEDARVIMSRRLADGDGPTGDSGENKDG